MGRIGSSSRKKHSKKKSLKVSSEARRKKKSRSNKSKKHRRHDDSFSSSSEDESTSSSLVSSSSSDGEYKSRKSRSRGRNEVKGSSKKRTRSRSLSEDSIPVKKRKGSKSSDSRKKYKKIKKKKKTKKKPKRDSYISSASSDSASCPTCKGGDSSSDEEDSRGRSREKKKNHRGNRKNRSKTRSSSPSKLSNSYDDDEIIEELPVENNSRRLKSVITFAKPPEHEPNEEIVYDYDDYPSCKSNDSNELVDRFNISPEKQIPTSVIGEVNSASSPNEKESNASGNIGPEVDNLESILRQKALENLSKFRGGLKTKPAVAVDNKDKSDQSVVKWPTSASVSVAPVSQPVVPRSRFTWRRDPSATTVKDKKAVAYSKPDSSGSEPAAAPKLQSAEKKIVNETPKSVANNDNTSGSQPAAAPKLQSAGKKIVNETPKSVANSDNISGSQPTAAPKLQSAEKKIMNETPKSVADNGNTSGGTGTDVDQKSTTALETPSASTKEGSLKGQQTESNDNSQFEKKTMSVMRGGEMVQVSYKVYIPKRAPALARRRLKR